VKRASEVIEVNFEELSRLAERARQGPLSEEDCHKLDAAIHVLRYLIETIGENDTAISQLRALLTKTSTEKTSKVLERAGIRTKGGSPPNNKPKPGHGRNGARAYARARRIKIAHASLRPGDPCPERWKGKVYRQKDPGLRIGLRIRWWARRRLRPRFMSWSVCAAYVFGDIGSAMYPS
jgi:transposase